MPAVKKIRKSGKPLGPESSSPRKKSVVSSSSLEIMDSEPITDIHQISLWLHGVPKIGKTSFAAKFDRAVFGMTEKGDKFQSVRKVDLVGKPWDQYEEFLELISNEDSCGTAIIDVLEIAHDECFRYQCEQLGIEHPNDANDFGKSWAAVRNPFIQWCINLTRIPEKGCIFLSHTSAKEITDSIGEQTEQLHPNLAGKALNAVEGAVDIIAYLGYVRGQRVMQIIGDDIVMAGSRSLETNFLNKDTGEPIKYIPMGKSASEAYENFIRAFENQQTNKHVESLQKKVEVVKKKTS